MIKNLPKRIAMTVILAVSIVGVGLTLTRTNLVGATYNDKPKEECTKTEKTNQCAEKPVKFDHSQCQYPERTTNPPNGCDNSAPCDPSNVKGASGECKPQPPQPTSPPEAPKTPEVPVVESECIGKAECTTTR